MCWFLCCQIISMMQQQKQLYCLILRHCHSLPTLPLLLLLLLPENPPHVLLPVGCNICQLEVPLVEFPPLWNLVSSLPVRWTKPQVHLGRGRHGNPGKSHLRLQPAERRKNPAMTAVFRECKLCSSHGRRLIILQATEPRQKISWATKHLNRPWLVLLHCFYTFYDCLFSSCLFQDANSPSLLLSLLPFAPCYRRPWLRSGRSSFLLFIHDCLVMWSYTADCQVTQQHITLWMWFDL